tara:strand:+ start:59 stop:262 length:204 start_codon:yes stop_codon:yes gene_type:complete
MTTAIYTKLKKELKKELFEELSEFMVRDSRDPEGEYRPEFVKKILRIVNKKERLYKYNSKTFSKLIS